MTVCSFINCLLLSCCHLLYVPVSTLGGNALVLIHFDNSYLLSIKPINQNYFLPHKCHSTLTGLKNFIDSIKSVPLNCKMHL